MKCYSLYSSHFDIKDMKTQSTVQCLFSLFFFFFFFPPPPPPPRKTLFFQIPPHLTSNFLISPPPPNKFLWMVPCRTNFPAISIMCPCALQLSNLALRNKNAYFFFLGGWGGGHHWDALKVKNSRSQWLRLENPWDTHQILNNKIQQQRCVLDGTKAHTTYGRRVTELNNLSTDLLSYTTFSLVEFQDSTDH